MVDSKSLLGAHPSFPLSAPALQSAALRPDFHYFEIHSARQLSAALGSSRPFFSAGELAAIGLLGQIYLSVVQIHLGANPASFSQLDAYLLSEYGALRAQQALTDILQIFPTPLLFSQPAQISLYQFGEKTPPANRHAFYCSLLLIFLAEQNPAIRSRDGYFTDPGLRQSAGISQLLSHLRDFFTAHSPPASSGKDLINTLLEPLRLHPLSLFDQLSYISQHWGSLLDPGLLLSLLSSLDHLKEEFNDPGPLPQAHSLNPLGHMAFGPLAGIEPVRFSRDEDWMPQVVLLAKNAFVWLDQLSKQHHKTITRLDQIPESELLQLSRSGITSLWLIGIWERSPASKKIKQLCGNPEAVSSAYSLYDYRIAETLGGEQAYQQLSALASKYHIRLAADMVPNHMGIDSGWVRDHPDWFLSLDASPFPAYSFSGPDLSSDPAVGIFLEDHYYDQTDASVVFRRVDNRSGQDRYLYHGNDGTSMPWNDTAQLNFLHPDAREAVIQTILHVARKFPIIRFDAAMTLTKKHFQRLWFPEPGQGGDIPTRSEYGLSKAEFDKLMPREFWREVVDRVAEEAPDTLLLAEAFWMMEGYFVRNLGMHRVYNSAFMHMLRDEDNHKYRELIIKTLELDPQILKRYVNFMNNPDEDTALSQFGSDGKYFGTCLMMCTLPGLPMFGHGQIEGLSEKYGMEYQRAYYDESANTALMERHAAEIYPLLHKRYLFSGVEHFQLYDLETTAGGTDPNVFAYSNRAGSERTLIINHNKWGATQGWIKSTAPLAGTSRDLLSGLGLSREDGDFLLYFDHITGLEFIRSLQETAENGLFFELGAYQYHALINFKTITDPDGSFQHLHDHLAGRGVPSLSMLKKELELKPLADKMVPVLDQFFGRQTLSAPFDPSPTEKFLKSFQQHFPNAFPAFDSALDLTIERFSQLQQLLSSQDYGFIRLVLRSLVPWALLAPVVDQTLQDEIAILVRNYLEYLRGCDHGQELDLQLLTTSLDLTPRLWTEIASLPLDLEALGDLWFSHPLFLEFLHINEHEGRSYFNQEAMEYLLGLTFALLSLRDSAISRMDSGDTPQPDSFIPAGYKIAQAALADSGYVVDTFQSLLKSASLGTQSSA